MASRGAPRPWPWRRTGSPATFADHRRRQRDAASLADACLDDARLAAEAGGRVPEFAAEVPERRAAAVPELHALQVAPDALVGVQLGRVGGQLLQAQARGGPRGQEVLDGLG